MTSPTPATLDALAAKLTKAQRRGLMKLPDVFTFWPRSIARVTIRRLRAAGLISFHPPPGDFGLGVYRPTPLGIALRNHIAKEPS